MKGDFQLDLSGCSEENRAFFSLKKGFLSEIEQLFKKLNRSVYEGESLELINKTKGELSTLTEAYGYSVVGNNKTGYVIEHNPWF